MPHIFLGDKTDTARINAIKEVFDTRSDIYDVTVDSQTASVYVRLKNSTAGFEISTPYYNLDSDKPVLNVRLIDIIGNKYPNANASLLNCGYNIRETWFDYLPTKDGILFGGYQENQALSHDTYVLPFYAGKDIMMGYNVSQNTFLTTRFSLLFEASAVSTYPTRISETAIGIAPVYLGDEIGFSDEVYFTTVRPPLAIQKVYTATIDGKNYYLPSPYAVGDRALFAFEPSNEA